MKRYTCLEYLKNNLNNIKMLEDDETIIIIKDDNDYFVEIVKIDDVITNKNIIIIRIKGIKNENDKF